MADAVEKTVTAKHDCLRANAAVDLQPSIEHTAAENLRWATEQAHTAHREQSVLVARTQRRYGAARKMRNGFTTALTLFDTALTLFGEIRGLSRQLRHRS
ncbi:hypothetical protein [Rhodococcus wratislaviensis]|uniref:hypothetical protein n=1 Tax=Rhodococcus wratislaviensis TaxID=44752 RepID=UPI00364B4C8B